MRRRKLIVAFAVGLMALVGVVAVVAWPRGNRITRENFDRIKDGMSRAEVEAILGPPGDYSSGPVAYSEADGINTRVVVDASSLAAIGDFWLRNVWSGDRALCGVYISEAGYVTRTPYGIGFFELVERVEQSPLDNLIWRAKRQWRKWFPPS
jgi:hypothetical protein